MESKIFNSDNSSSFLLCLDSKAEAAIVCEQLKARKDNFGTSLTALTSTRIAEAAEAYNILTGLHVSLGKR